AETEAAISAQDLFRNLPCERHPRCTRRLSIVVGGSAIRGRYQFRSGLPARSTATAAATPDQRDAHPDRCRKERSDRATANGQLLADHLPHNRYALLEGGHLIWEDAP